MKAVTPSFKSEKEVFYADSCLPLMEAAGRGDIVVRALGRHGYPGERIAAHILPGLSSAGWWDARRAQTWGLPQHRNEGIEFTFMETGQSGIRVENHPLTLHFDHMLITRPWQPHQIGDPFVQSGRLIWLILDVGMRRPHHDWHWPSWIVLQRDDLADLTRYLRQNEQYIWKVSPEMRRCFQGIAQALQVEPIARSLSPIAIWINSLLLQALAMFRTQNIPLTESLTGAERSVKQFLEELHAGLDKPWTLETMAENCDLGVTRFVYYVRHLTNVSPAEYLLAARIEKACRLLLADPSRSVAEVARACGFSSSQYFTTIFRRRLRKTPAAYRQAAGRTRRV